MEKTTLPVLNKYERASILAQRAADIGDGAPITVKDPGTSNPLDIAKIELEQGTIPKKLIRKFPNGKTEVWTVREMNNI